MHILYCIFVRFMQFPEHDFRLDHFAPWHFNSSLSVLMSYNMLSGTTKHCKSNEPESHQMAKIIFFPSFLFFRIFSSDVLVQKHSTWQKVGEEPENEARFSQKQQHFTLSSTCTSSSLSYNIEVSQVVQTSYRSMGSFAMPFLHLYVWAQSNYYSKSLN